MSAPDPEPGARIGPAPAALPGPRSGEAGRDGAGGPEPGAGPADDEVPEPDPSVAATIAELSEPELVPARRRGLVWQLARQSGATRRWRPRAAVRWVVDTVNQIAPYVPVRSLETLSRHHRGRLGDQLAERLIRNAARATAGVGGASGGLAAVKWAAPPTLLSAPVLLAAETVAVVAIEIKLVGELHTVHQVPLPAGAAARSTALLRSWAAQRGVTAMPPTIGAATVLGTAARKELADRLARRFSSNLTTLAPMLIGASVAGYLNRRATRALGDQLRLDLARRLD